MARWDDAWEDWRIEDLEIKPIDDDRVLSLFRMVATGKESGIELSRDDASITELRDGKVLRIAYYNDRTQALADAGLRE
jgi:ketosteroid isomerase-like protein